MLNLRDFGLNGDYYMPPDACAIILRTHTYRILDRAFMLRRFRALDLYRTPFHLVTPSPWPLFVSVALFILILGVIKYIHGLANIGGLVKCGFLLLVWAAVRWWRDVIYEGFTQGVHTGIVQRGLRLGFLLFIFSEIMFFAAFFWAFFHSSLSPSVEIAGGWPPVRSFSVLSEFNTASLTFVGIEVFNPWHIPFLNTLLLLGSGAWLTYVHASVQWQRLDSTVARRYRVLFPLLRKRPLIARSSLFKKFSKF